LSRGPVAALVAALLAGCGTAGGPSPEAVDPAGLGESLVVVVAGTFPSAQAAETAISSELSLGELDGFHAVPVTDLHLDGAYVRSAPGRDRVPCATTTTSAGACGLGTVELALVPLDRLDAAREEPCIDTLDSVELPLCFEPGEAALRAAFEDPTRWAAVTAFRTLAGATRFLGMVEAMRGPGFAVDLLVVHAVRTAGNTNIGLGREERPDGSGPLGDELPDQASHQTAP